MSCLMSHLPTLCEINYDKCDAWEEQPIPYRYRALSAQVNKKNSVQYSTRDVSTSASFYELQSNYFRVPSAMTNHTEGRRSQTVFSNYSQGPAASRSGTVPPPGHGNPDFSYLPGEPPFTRRDRQDSRARTAPCMSLPNLRGRLSAMAPHTNYGDQDEERLKWVPALNTWVADKNQNSAPYVTFVNSMHLKNRGHNSDFMVEEAVVSYPTQPCGRFITHMHLQQDAAKHLFTQRQSHTIWKRRLRHDRDDKMQTSRSQPSVPIKSLTKVRFEKPASPPPPPQQQPPPPPAPKPAVPPPPPPPRTEDKGNSPVPSRNLSPKPQRLTPPPSQSVTAPPDIDLAAVADQLADSVKEACIKESAQCSEAPLNSHPSQTPTREPSPIIPTPTPTQVLEVEEPAPPTSLTPVALPPQGLETTRTPTQPPPPQVPASKLRDEPSKPPKDKTSPQNKTKSKKKPKADNKPRQDNQKKATDKGGNMVVNVKDPQSLELRVQAHDKIVNQYYYNMCSHLFPKKPPPVVMPQLDPCPSSPEPMVESHSPRSVSTLGSAISPSDFDEESLPSSPGVGERGQREKRVRWRAGPRTRPDDNSTPSPRMPSISKRRVSEWMWSDDEDEDYSAVVPDRFSDRDVNSSLDPLPSPSPSVQPTPTPPPTRKSTPKTPLSKRKPPGKPRQKKKWGPKKVDKTLQEERERERLAEERRQKLVAQQKGRHSMTPVPAASFGQGPRFDDYTFLSKYCIFSKEKLELYRRVFESKEKVVDEDGRGWLSPEDVIVALRAVNRALTHGEEVYLKRILELTGYKASTGADFKLFAVMAGLSQRITALDEWMRSAIDCIDLKALDLKMYMCKLLWQCNVDEDTNRIPLDQLCVELRAGGISANHESEVRHSLRHLRALDLLDFLTYVPLFITIHMSVVENPFDDSRDK